MTQARIGILGGGQLSLMLAQAAEKLKIEVTVLSETEESPARLNNCNYIKGNLGDDFALQTLFESSSVVTIENEFLPIEAIQKVIDKTNVKLLPSLEVIEVTQNKLNQKFLFQKLKIASSPFKSFDPQFDNLDSWITGLNQPCVIKWARGGYDGKGNFVYRGEKKEALSFCQSAIKNKTTVYAEEFIPFKKELAMVFCRSENNEFVFYPLVISEQQDNVCKTVYGPAVNFDVPSNLELQAAQIGKKIAEHLNFFGTFALEFFLTNDNQLLVNEMAPRVHNSGHYTQDTYKVDQFENHLRAITGMRLEPPNQHKLFMMHNLLGPAGLTINLPNQDLVEAFPQHSDLKFHWYGKTSLSPMRKMGHINCFLETTAEVESKKIALMDVERNIWQNLRKKFGNL